MQNVGVQMIDASHSVLHRALAKWAEARRNENPFDATEAMR